ncbi:MAG: UDP-N-acetylmuramate dehydrogenase [bacterium]
MYLKENFNLTNYNTFRINCISSYFSECENYEEVQKIIDFCRVKKLELLVLGGGSNVLFTKNFYGLILHYATQGIRIFEENNEFIVLESDAGTEWDFFVNYCVQNNYYGVENLSLIPGNVGASPIQNIGAYGVEIKDIFHSLDYIELNTGEIKTLGFDGCNFGYRTSVFKTELKNEALIIKVRYKLSKVPKYNLSYKPLTDYFFGSKEPSLKEIRNLIIEVRNSKLPDYKTLGNAGSFFKNPEVDETVLFNLKVKYPDIVSFPLGNNKCKISAGWLIDNCGLKGFRNGEVGTYQNQALILINYGKANGSDILGFAEFIKSEVKNKFNIILETEVNII